MVAIVPFSTITDTLKKGNWYISDTKRMWLWIVTKVLPCDEWCYDSWRWPAIWGAVAANSQLPTYHNTKCSDQHCWEHASLAASAHMCDSPGVHLCNDSQPVEPHLPVAGVLGTKLVGLPCNSKQDKIVASYLKHKFLFFLDHCFAMLS